jgi:hypothetical protein
MSIAAGPFLYRRFLSPRRTEVWVMSKVAEWVRWSFLAVILGVGKPFDGAMAIEE